MIVLFFVINTQKKIKIYNQLNISNLKKTMCYLQNFYNMLKTYYYFKNHNMKNIENQCIDNRVITLLFHSY